MFTPTLDRYVSRRSMSTGTEGMVACNQSLAAASGVDALRAGGTAADAAVAVAATLQVTEPASTGLGGDAFWIYYDAAADRITAYNGSGRSAAAFTLEKARGAAGIGATGVGSAHSDAAGGVSAAMPRDHPYTVTVPGAPEAWQRLLDRFGALPRARVVSDAIRLAERGFPVAPETAYRWRTHGTPVLSATAHGHELVVDGGDGPQAGQVVRLPRLADTLGRFAVDGAAPFYHGGIARRIVETLSEAGGLISMEDLERHHGEYVTPASVEYGGSTVYELPPNGQGLATLVALAVLARTRYDRHVAAGDLFLNPEALHRQIEAMRAGFAVARRHVADPAFYQAPIGEILSDSLLSEWARDIEGGRIDPARFRELPSVSAGSDTVYFCTADRHGNMCSFINSTYMGFGTGIVPRGCGYTLQNRGLGFSLQEGHPNAAAPGKRPYHTIIPGLIATPVSPAAGPNDGDGATGVTSATRATSATSATSDDGGGIPRREITAFGVMGGFMQPQGHLQVVSALLDGGLDPQSVLDRGRFCIADGVPDGEVLLEPPYDDEIAASLHRMGHRVRIVIGRDRAVFGRGQIIARRNGAYLAGADPRGDGIAIGY